ncbi:MAG: ABC transporter permease subunit [Clostridiales bacterium]|nr:ABC transporter permease subunit [Clostridiales bacterium]
MLAPLLLVMGGIFFLGLILGLVESFGWFPAIGLRTFTFDFYKKILNDPNVLSSLRFSLYTSLTASVISTALGVFLSRLIIKTNRRKEQPLPGIFRVPIYVPHIIVALFIFVLLTQSGLFARLLFALGIISDMQEFPKLIFDRGGIGIILAYIWKELPFITYVTYDIFRTLDTRYDAVAATLGANAFKRIRHIYLPQLWPAITGGFVMIFAYTFGSYETPLLLGPTTPRALPILSYIYYSSINLSDHLYAMACNMLIVLFILIILAFGRILERILRRVGGLR